MSEFTLCSEQVELLHKYASEFQEWLKTPEGKEDVKIHRDHEAYFKENLSPENIEKMTEDKFREIYKAIWASDFFHNKDWRFNNLIIPNGLDRITAEFGKLLYGTEDFSARYDKFRIKGFGPSSLTEILHFLFPDTYCLWNITPKTVMQFLKIDKLPQKFFKSNFTKGKEYLQIVSALSIVKDELRDFGITDFIDLDIFFWHIYDDVMPNIDQVEPPLEPSRINIDSHEAAEFYLIELGNLLRFDTYTVDQSKFYGENRLGDITSLNKPLEFAGERTLNIVKNIDVMWFGEHDNPTHCFEVEHTTDINTGLSRLILIYPGTARLFIVAPENKRRRYEQFMDRIPYRRRSDDFRFISYKELAELYEKAAPYHKLKAKILGE